MRARLYSYKMLDGSEDKKCKGLTKKVTKWSIQFDVIIIIIIKLTIYIAPYAQTN